MRAVALFLLVAAGLAAAEPPVVATPGEGDRRIALFARNHVQLELHAPMGAQTARAVLTNRRDIAVLVEFTVEQRIGDKLTYVVDLQPEETRGSDGRYVIPVHGQPNPRATIVRVDTLPIEEASGYVRLAEERRDRVTITLYRPDTGGDRVFAVLVNADDRAVEVSWEASGLIEGDPLRFTTALAAHAVSGRDGRHTLPYKPIADPRYRTRPRIRIHAVTVTPR